MARLFGRSVTYLLLMLFPMVLLAVVLAKDGLMLWLGAEFAQRSVRVLQWLAVGVFINSLGQVPFAMVQGVGRPDLTAKLHLIEVPAYLAVLWWLTKTHGIEGAAIAWTARAAADDPQFFALRVVFSAFPRRTEACAGDPVRVNMPSAAADNSPVRHSKASSRYDSDVIRQDAYDRTWALLKLVGTGKRVLEVGCSTGYMSRHLMQRNCSVTGIEVDTDAAEKARHYCREVLIRDLNAPD